MSRRSLLALAGGSLSGLAGWRHDIVSALQGPPATGGTRRRAGQTSATVPPTVPAGPRFSANQYPDIQFTNAEFAERDFVTLQQSAVHSGGVDSHGNAIGDPQRVSKIKALNPNCKVLLYDFLQTTWDWSYKWDQLQQHPDWFLTVNGRRCVNPDPNDRQYLMDINNPAYIAWITSYYAREVQAYGFDGFFQDGIWPTIDLGQRHIGWRPAPPAAYQQNWRQYMHNLYAALRAKIGSKLIIASCTPVNGNDFGTDDMYLDVLDGTLCEGWVHEPWARQLDPNAADWAFCRQVLQRNVARGKYFLALSGTADIAERQLRLYTYCTYLLDADGRYAVYEWGYGTRWEAEIRRDIGTAVGPAAPWGSVWKREFSKATITVDPNAKRGTIALK